MRKLAVAGAGYWGRNVVRTFHQLLGPRLKYICDTTPETLKKIQNDFPTAQTTQSFAQVLDDPEIDAVAIATPAVTHYELARQALLKGKHVYVEKPLTLKLEESEELVELSRKNKLVLMVGHILIYHPAVKKIKELINSGDLGKIYYLYAQRLNLGRVRTDENAMWSFAPHDFSVIFYLLGDKQIEMISACGQSFLNKGVEDVVFVNMRFTTGEIANVHLSWLDPHKRRSLTVVGDKKMVVFDDAEASEKLWIYDKGVEMAGDYKTYGEYIQLRYGDITIPKIDLKEPLHLTCDGFLKAIEQGTPPRFNAREALRVVRALNAAQKSLENSGMPVPIDESRDLA